MPTMNFYYQQDTHKSTLAEHTARIKEFVASELTCGDIELNSNEVSVRYLRAFGDGMIAPLEVEIAAHAFGERIAEQDNICLHIRSFLMEILPDTDVRVWLLLPQLGHSWD